MPVLTKAQQIEKYLKHAILSGSLSPGERLPSEEKLLSQFRVSRTTLRSALHSLASNGMLMRRHGSGTYVSEGCGTGTIAILAEATDLSCPMGYWFRTLVQEAQRQIGASGYRTHIFIGHGSTEEEFIDSLNLLDHQSIKETLGVLRLTSVGMFESRIADAGISCVAIESCLPTTRHSIVLDHARSIELAIEAFRAHSYEDIALMYMNYSEEPLYALNRQRREMQTRLYKGAVGYRNDRLIPAPYCLDYGHAYEVFKEWWARDDRPNAILFTDDALCDIASRAMLEMGIRVPEDLAVITYANLGRKFHFPVELVGIGYDPALVVSHAWGMLSKLISHVEVEVPVAYIEPTLFPGNSI